MKFNLFQLLKIIQVIPFVVSGIENIVHDEKAGAAKKQLAYEALGIAANTASSVVPDGPDKQMVSAGADFVGSMIDNTVQLFNQFGWPQNPNHAQTASK